MAELAAEEAFYDRQSDAIAQRLGQFTAKYGTFRTRRTNKIADMVEYLNDLTDYALTLMATPPVCRVCLLTQVVAGAVTLGLYEVNYEGWRKTSASSLIWVPQMLACLVILNSAMDLLLLFEVGPNWLMTSRPMRAFLRLVRSRKRAIAALYTLASALSFASIAAFVYVTIVYENAMRECALVLGISRNDCKYGNVAGLPSSPGLDRYYNEWSIVRAWFPNMIILLGVYEGVLIFALAVVTLRIWNRARIAAAVKAEQHNR